MKSAFVVDVQADYLQMSRGLSTFLLTSSMFPRH